MSKANPISGHTINLGEGPVASELYRTASKMDDLNDVDLNNVQPSTGDVLVFDGSAWVPNHLLSGGTAGQILVKQSSAVFDAAWVDPSTAGINVTRLGDFGFDIVHVTNTQFRIDGLDVTNIYYPTQYLRIRNGAAIAGYATIDSSDYNITSTGNTTINITWDLPTVDILPPTNQIQIYTLASNIGWAAHASSSFGGTNFRGICSGYDEISQLVHWLIIGDLGVICTSNDRGATWTKQSSPTTDNLVACCYQPDQNYFYIISATGFWSSSDFGVTWTDESANVSGTNHTDVSPYSGGVFFCDTTIASGLYRDSSSGAFITPAYTALYPSLFAFNYDQNAYAMSRSGVTFTYPSIWGDEGSTPFTTAPRGSSSSGMGTPSCIASVGKVHSTTFVGGTSNGGIWKDVGSRTTPVLNDITPIGAGYLGSSNVNGIAWSRFLDSIVAVADDGKIIHSNLAGVNDPGTSSFKMVANPFGLTNINAVTYDETDRIWFCVGDNGMVASSLNGFS